LLPDTFFSSAFLLVYPDLNKSHLRLSHQACREP
jgi:hypothetical protein